METKEWRFRDMVINGEQRFTYVDEWPEGPWDDEPDKVQWEDPVTKLACLVVRNRMGAWCGYVGLPEGHPWREKGYDDIPVEVHGGLTYGPSPCREGEEETGICHVPEDGADDDLRWIGFDCNHFMDAAPSMIVVHKKYSIPAMGEDGELRETYKDLTYVKAEVTALAAQVAAVS